MEFRRLVVRTPLYKTKTLAFRISSVTYLDGNKMEVWGYSIAVEFWYLHNFGVISTLELRGLESDSMWSFDTTKILGLSQFQSWENWSYANY